VFVVHGTKKFLDRVKSTPTTHDQPPTTALGNWDATVLFWKPQIALFVNERTLLPVLVPLAPAATVIDRFPGAAAAVFRAHNLDRLFVDREVAAMAEHGLAKTTNRSVVGIMNEFAHLGGIYRSRGTHDLLTISLRLAQTPCGPLYGGQVSPDREVAAVASRLSR
jgi:hypothetical protein